MDCGSANERRGMDYLIVVQQIDCGIKYIVEQKVIGMQNGIGVQGCTYTVLINKSKSMSYI